MKKTVFACTVAAATAVTVLGCSGPGCFDTRGVWEITEHCDPSYVGDMITLSDADQGTCQAYTTTQPFAGWYFQANGEGRAHVYGDLPSGGTASCDGTATEAQSRSQVSAHHYSGFAGGPDVRWRVLF